ncbi:MAG: SDR family oxidoreductase [Cytophagales bacterium]|nr:SDR family oxidoreductase [Cytophagales bacterium]
MKKTILITGATSGIGYEAAKAIASAGHQLVFTARDTIKAEIVKEELSKTNPLITYLIADFSSLESVKNAATEFEQTFGTLDVLVNNAGTWEMEFQLSKDGIEMNFAVNHLAPFLLTNRLIPLLKKAPSARIVNTSSMAHRRNIFDPANLEYRNLPYNGVATYSQSKLCNLLFTLELTKILKGTSVTANTVHPGYVQSNLFNKMGARDLSGIPSAADGARSTIFAALSDKVEGLNGRYFYHEHEEEPTAMAKDEKLSKILWDKSLEYVKNFMPN